MCWVGISENLFPCVSPALKILVLSFLSSFDHNPNMDMSHDVWPREFLIWEITILIIVLMVPKTAVCFIHAYMRTHVQTPPPGLWFG